MSGIELRGDTLVVDREPNALDELAIDFSAVLSDLDVEHVYIAGYLAILTGRPRATDDIDVLVEPLSETEIETVVEELRDADYWGPAMPLEEMYGNLSEGTNIWVAPDGQTTPHLEVKFPTDEFDRASLSNAIEARVAGETIPIGPLELQIAYKLYLGGQKDFEDAAHLYSLFGETLRETDLEHWATELDVLDTYERLREI
ncbi:hypothetical protein [Natronobacterium texcoconense]|uniref:Nucleotidyl transferase AbiEii toxin, Type IV TA system n=1 Tax=Natronobacterium texcoconense TaxID=1095778 RepID=A0A1H1IAG6_NATTX|nr:hypothetical protein [Natronobacterium texcoconense]SDR34617.1 hypothetical protein SAMN04489842_3359 [Natronobacterium texcoconense]